MHSRTLISIAFAIILLAGLSPIASAHVRPSSDGPRVWNVLVGGQSENKAIQGEAFYPGVITIDAGDTVVWTLNSDEPHTVTFFGTEPLSAECAAASDFAPCPVPLPASYDGISFAGSGFMIRPSFNWDNSFPLPHGNTTFTLTFANPGAYVYLSVLQAGMQGVVVVQPKGTPYPFSQQDYSKQAQEQLRADLAAGTHALASFKPPRETSGPGVTEIHFVATGISAPETSKANLLSLDSSSTTGTASLAVAVNSTSATLTAKVDLQGLNPGTAHSIQIDYGVCGSTATVSPFMLPPISLNQVTAGRDGRGESVTSITIPASGNGLQNLRLQSAGWFVTVGQTSTEGSPAIACGNIRFHNVTVQRFLPAKLTINVGDTVVWEQLALNSHPLILFPAGQPIPPFPDSVALPPNGNATSYDGKTLFASGGIFPAQSFVLTFTQPGTNPYVNPPEIQLGMQGSIIVRSNSDE